MDTVCLTAQGKLHIVVDDEGDPTDAAELADEPGFCKKIGFIQLLFAQLHTADTAVDGSADLVIQADLRAGPFAVGDRIQ